MRSNLLTALTAGLVLALSGAAWAATFDNSSGTGTWEEATNWDTDAVPDTSSGPIYLGGHTVSLQSAQTVYYYYINGSVLNVETGAMLAVTNGQTFVAADGTMNLNGGTINSDRFRVVGNGVVNQTGGTNYFSGRMLLEDTSVYKMSGGTVAETSGFIQVQEQAQLIIEGDGATLNLGSGDLQFYTGTATDCPTIGFVFGETGVTTLQADILSLAGHSSSTESLAELTVDLTDLTGLSAGTHVFKLIDGVRSLEDGEEFAVETIIGDGGGAITSAVISYDTANADVLLTVEAIAVPEPATLSLVACGALAMLRRRRTR